MYNMILSYLYGKRYVQILGMFSTKSLKERRLSCISRGDLGSYGLSAMSPFNIETND